MNEPFANLFALTLQDPWVIPSIGVAVSGLAFVVGRRFFGSHRFNPRSSESSAPAQSTIRTGPDKDIFLHGSYGDRRSAPRRKGNSVEVDVRDDSHGPVVHAWVLDRSLGGLCLVVEKPIAEGTFLDVRARSAAESVPWTPIEVKGCRAHKNEWELNCQFLQTPSWNVMLLFG